MPEVFDHNGMYTEEGKEIFRETYQLLKSDFRELHRNGYHVRDIESVYFDVVCGISAEERLKDAAKEVRERKRRNESE